MRTHFTVPRLAILLLSSFSSSCLEWDDCSIIIIVKNIISIIIIINPHFSMRGSTRSRTERSAVSSASRGGATRTKPSMLPRWASYVFVFVFVFVYLCLCLCKNKTLHAVKASIICIFVLYFYFFFSMYEPLSHHYHGLDVSNFRLPIHIALLLHLNVCFWQI